MNLKEKVIAYNTEIKEALQTVYDALNKGQKQKLMKDKTVKSLMERYHVNTEEHIETVGEENND